MANQKLTQRSYKGVSASNDIIHIVSNSTSYKQTVGVAVDDKIQVVSDQLAGISSGYKGFLGIADTPIEDGYYYASDAGTYTNAGSLVVSLSSKITIITVSDTQTTFEKLEIPIDTLGYEVVRTIGEFDTLVTAGTSGVWMILDDITLTADKTIPADVTLLFNGGSISLGGFTLTGNNTMITANIYNIFDSSGVFAGTWNVKEVYPEWFGAVGDGTTNDLAAIDVALTFKNIRFENQYLVDDTIETSRTCNIYGKGTIIADNSFVNKTFLSILDDKTSVKGLTFTNPNLNNSQTGGRTTCIGIKANEVIISECEVDSFENGIAVFSVGEFFDVQILNNRVLNVIGVGDGALNTTSTYGEDRGDGIAFWGASGIISGNLVTCKDGYDSRIGIHCEALEGSEVTSPTYSDTSVIISNNIIRGAFRRAISNEGLNNVVINDNVVTGGCTWWGIAVILCDNTTVIGNTILFDRDAADLTGDTWSPVHAAIMIRSVGAVVTDNTLIQGNVIKVTGEGQGLVATSSGSNINNIKITDNLFQSTVNTVVGLNLAEGSGYQAENNYIEGFVKGIRLYGLTNHKLTGNTIRDINGAAITIEATTSTGHIDVSNNFIDNCLSGISMGGYNIYCTGNKFFDITNRALTISTVSKCIVKDNIATGTYGTNVGTFGTNTIVYKNNIGLSINESVATTQITDITSFLNTYDKYKGKIIMDTTGDTYIAQGSSAGSDWKLIEDGTTTTPA